MAKKSTKTTQDDKLTLLMDHYNKGVQDMDTRRTRKNGWNEIIDAYMNKLDLTKWPYTSVVTDPRIRTTILEKTARLLNSKLQGRLIPREGGDIIKARINNAILDFQWDFADDGGAMIEKVALADQVARIYGAAFVYVYWDNKKNSNEIKVCDPRDILWDFSATHARNAKWVQYREYSTPNALEARGYDVSGLRKIIDENERQSSDLRSTNYESEVKLNRGLEDRVGQDLSNPVIEIVTEYTKDSVTVFAPRYGTILHTGKNPYKHGKLPFAQLRYYPLGDDIYGESEVESVIPLQRAINAVLCGFIDTMNLSMRPPLKLITGAYQKGSIEYGPGAQWIVNRPDAVTEAQIGEGAIANFNATYPALVAAFNTAMGDQSLGTSNVGGGGFTEKTATEVASLERQQSQRDQYNQLYLAEFLKDIMLMWLSNNKQYLFDDPSKKYFVLKIVGKDNVQMFQQMLLDEKDIPDEAMQEIAATVEANPDIPQAMIDDVVTDVAVPTNPVITNPEEENPENYDVKSKLSVGRMGDMADLYVTPDDLVGVYDYVPDVKSMSAGAGLMMQTARDKFMERILNPQVSMMLQTQGESVKIKELLVSDAENAGYRDAESLFQPLQQPALPAGPGVVAPSVSPLGATPNGGIPTVPQAVSSGAGPIGLPQPQGLPGQGQAFT